MKTQVKRIVALMLAVAMTISFVGCKRTPQAAIKTTEEAIQSTVELQQATQNMELSAPTEYDRDSMEEIAEMLGVSKEEVKNLDDGQILEKVEELLNETDNKKDKGSKDKSDKTEIPSTNVGDNDENYDEDGAMTKPFDQIYPELVAEGAVAYDEETLLIKMSNSRDGEITKAMSEAGVSLLEAVVPMEKSTWYEAKLFPGADAMVAVKMLRELDEIQMVDFNYVVETNGMADPQAIPEEIEITDKTNNQWHLKYCQYPQGHGLLKKKGGDPSVVVAVIDTGVDYDHEDLAQNIWKNTAEIADNGIDDDNNGYIDDYYGVNIITRQGNGDDDHGHGTHVAGIIAAQNNKIGVVGLAYNVKIMPIKAGMASGYFNQSDVAKAVLYAYEHGAQVINMSFGGTACSIAVQDALEVAYSRCVLVASAGNDTFINEPAKNTMLKIVPNYPAALSYVIGVMSVGQSGVESGFTNIDGKLYTKTEYEVYAPGEGILSTIPNDQYASWSGTSMAAPIVSAIAAIVRGEYSDLNTYPTKFIYGQLTATSSNSAICGNPALHGEHNVPNIINLYEALTKLPTPDVGLYDYALFDTVGLTNDTAGKNNGDGVIDAGETFALGLTLRNRWGKAVDTTVTIDTLSPAGTADPYIEIINPTVNYGEVGTYSTADCGAVYEDDMLVAWENPFYIRIKEDCPNDYIFRLNVTITAKNGLDENDSSTYSNDGAVELTVRSGTILPSIIEEDMTLTKDNLWIVPNGTTILSGATVTVEPGTYIQFWSNDPSDPYADQYIAGIDVKGRFIVNGTPEEMVYIYPSELMSQYNVEIKTSENGYASINYADITNFGKYNGSEWIDRADHCIFRQNYNTGISERFLSGGQVRTARSAPIIKIRSATNNIFYKIGSNNYNTTKFCGVFDNCIFADCDFKSEGFDHRFKNCVFLGNNMAGDINPSSDEVSNYPVISYSPENMLKETNYKLYYDSETGTTYLAYYDYNGTDNDYVLSKVKAAGGNYAIVNTEKEKYAIGRLDTSWRVMTVYNEAEDRYYWYDGTPIAEFADPDGVQYGYTKDTLCYYNKLGATNYSVSWYAYEIPGEIYAEDIFFDEYVVDVDTESTYKIIPQSTPATEKFIFESGDETVVTVDDKGVVTPVSKGTANVYVFSFDKAVWNYVTVNVVDYVALESITLANETKDLFLGESFNVGVTFTPSNTTRKNVTYTSSDETVATVDKVGNVTATGRGSATITAASSEGFEAVTTVNAYKKTTEIVLEKTVVTASVEGGAIDLPSYTVTDGEDAVLQWKSTDTSVAVIEDGKLVPAKEGTTSIILADTRSGVSASALVYVKNEEIPLIVKTAGHDSTSYSLDEDGNLYKWTWSLSGSGAQLYMQNVLDFSYVGGHLALITKDGTIYDEYNNIVTDFFKGKSVKKIIRYGGNFVLTSDGYVYSWGYNTNGILGHGHTERVETPSVINIENVVDIGVSNYPDMLHMLTKDGKAYVTGGEVLQYSIPFLTEENVDRFGEHSSNSNDIVAMIIGDTVKTYQNDGTKYIVKHSHSFEDYDMITFGHAQRGYGIKDGELYYIYVSGGAKLIPTPAEAIYVHYGNNNRHHVATADGMLYAFDGENFSLVNTFVIENDNLSLVTSNLEENVLSAEKLVLEFNKEIIAHGISLYADGEKVPVTVDVKHNVVTLSRSAGFEAGVNYKAVITSLTGMANVTLTEEMEIQFTSDFNAAEEDANDVIVPEEKVVHESARDEAMERFYWTIAGFIEELDKAYAKEHINPRFYGNVILNRISTDTNPANWMRIIAPSTSTYTEVPLGGNYWGTTNEALIGKQIVDYSDYNSYARILWENYLTEAPEDVFPFITDVTILDKNGDETRKVGAEEITVKVSFNRDMDTSIPFRATFGSAYPYADYTIEGEYTDPRTWQGTYTVSTLIEGGTSYFNFANGMSATDNLMLCEDTARFSFDIDNTAAQALIMQGYATDSGIQLSWTQDDFDTLMGYNVYRSTSEDGYYQRINNTIIPADTKEFFDDTVEPGIQYYYNFTVVKTDMNESVPSGKITIMSKDTMAPDIYHTPVYNAFTGSNLIISATVTDNLNLSYVRAYYRTTGAEGWNVSVMSKLNDKYSAIIPANDLTLDGIEYYIEAYDGINYTYKGSATSPYAVTIQQAVDATSLGDVNGDGKITNLDALMLLQAINDKLNLTSEQFTRADLDGNGVLQAFEALRILQYVNGTVGSVVIG